MRLTLLGTGTSMGIPQIGCSCAVCRSDDPHDRRTRSGAVVDTGNGRILIDTPPELRLQLLAAGIDRIDAVLYTHLHADHVHGIDDLRSFSQLQRTTLPLHGPGETLRHIDSAFRYIFDNDVIPVEGTSKPRLALHALRAGTTHDIAGAAVTAMAFSHGPTTVFGYRIGALGYVTDVKRVEESERATLRGVEVLVLSALWWRPHPTHLSIDEAIETARDIGASRTILTHLTHETGHRELARRLPPGIEPGHDGMTVEVSA